MENRQYQQPLYTLRVDAGGCAYDVRINDCPVMANEEGKGATVELPVNEWIFTERNLLKITMVRTLGHSGKCVAEVRVREIESEPNSAFSIIQLSVIAPALDPEKKEEPILVTEEAFEAEVDFPRWRWAQSTSIEMTSVDKEEILVQTNNLWNAFAAKDLEMFKQYLVVKNEELCHAYYQTVEKRNQEVNFNFEDFIDDKKWKLASLDTTDAILVPYGDNRIFQLLDRVTKESPLFFISTDQLLASYVPLFFYKDIDQLWRIAR